MANPDSQPADDTVRLIREGMIHAEQLSRYYLYLAHRFRRLGDLLDISRRLRSVLLYSPVELPLSNRLIRGCQQEAVEYWSPRIRGESHEESTG